MPNLRKSSIAAMDALMATGPWHKAFAKRSREHLIVLAYHGVDDREMFEWQLRYLTGILHPVSCDEVVRSWREGVQLPHGAVLLTFDDGCRSVFENGLPLLRELSIPAVVFVIGALVDSVNPSWWEEVVDLVSRGAVIDEARHLPAHDVVRVLKRMPDDDRIETIKKLREQYPEVTITRTQLVSGELREFQAAGIEIGNHTMTHPCLSKCTAVRVQHEIRSAHAVIARATGIAPRSFAFPNGDVAPAARGELERLGYELGFLFDHRLQALPLEDPLHVSRLRVGSTTSENRYRAVVSGLHPYVHRYLGRQ